MMPAGSVGQTLSTKRTAFGRPYSGDRILWGKAPAAVHALRRPPPAVPRRCLRFVCPPALVQRTSPCSRRALRAARRLFPRRGAAQRDPLAVCHSTRHRSGDSVCARCVCHPSPGRGVFRENDVHLWSGTAPRRHGGDVARGDASHESNSHVRDVATGHGASAEKGGTG